MNALDFDKGAAWFEILVVFSNFDMAQTQHESPWSAGIYSQNVRGDSTVCLE